MLLRAGKKVLKICEEYYVTELNCTVNFRDDKICTSDGKVLISLVIKTY